MMVLYPDGKTAPGMDEAEHRLPLRQASPRPGRLQELIVDCVETEQGTRAPRMEAIAIFCCPHFPRVGARIPSPDCGRVVESPLIWRQPVHTRLTADGPRPGTVIIHAFHVL
jgi:hypothetical protein